MRDPYDRQNFDRISTSANKQKLDISTRFLTDNCIGRSLQILTSAEEPRVPMTLVNAWLLNRTCRASENVSLREKKTFDTITRLLWIQLEMLALTGGNIFTRTHSEYNWLLCKVF